MSLPNQAPKISFEELCQKARVSERTVRYYVHEGLLPPSEGSGRAANYNQDHVLRLVAIRYLNKALGQSLAQIRGIFKTITRPQLESYYQAAQARSFDYEQDNSKDTTGFSTEQSGSSALDYLQKIRADQNNPARKKTLHDSPQPSLSRPSQDFDADRINQAPARESIDSAQSSQRQAANPDPTVPGESWQRVMLAPEVELHFKNLSPHDERYEKINRLLEQARKIFGF